MPKVNLSRIHHIIKNHNDDIVRLSNRISNLKLKFTFTIYTNTTQNDFCAFKDRLHQKKEELLKLQAEIEQNLKYIEYLKNTLSKANQNSGIDKLLNKNSLLSRKIRILKDLAERLEYDENQDIEIIKEVDFYKSAFTEQNKSYNLNMNIFTEKEQLSYQHELTDLIRQQQKLNDDIASLNQASKVEIMDFDNFIKSVN